MPNYDEILKTLTKEGQHFFVKHPEMKPLMAINPTFNDGDCAITTMLTWNFCTQGNEIEENVHELSEEQLDVHRRTECEWRDQRAAQRQSFFDEPLKFLSYLESCEDGSIFHIDTEDHVYNVIKFTKDDIWIVDTSSGLYKQINSIQSLTYERCDLPDSYIVTEEIETILGHNFCEVGEDDSFDVYPGGKLRDFSVRAEQTAEDGKAEKIEAASAIRKIP